MKNTEPADTPDVYRERAMVVAALARILGTGWIGTDTDEPDWPVLYIETAAGQLSWHISPTDADVLAGIQRGDGKWDGHTTAEKYQRLARLPLAQTAPTPSGDAADHEVEGFRWIETECCVICDEPVVHAGGKWQHSEAAIRAESAAALQEAREGWRLANEAAERLLPIANRAESAEQRLREVEAERDRLRLVVEVVADSDSDDRIGELKVDYVTVEPYPRTGLRNAARHILAARPVHGRTEG